VSPLRQLVIKFVDDKVLQAVAAEHRKGRRLLIATTNLDAQRPVIWDMGAIACSGDSRALQLFRDAMVASASVPVAFPPVYITVELDGKRYDEMHVDGGAFTRVFLWGGGFTVALASQELGNESLNRRARLYVIRNAMMSPGYERPDPLACNRSAGWHGLQSRIHPAEGRGGAQGTLRQRIHEAIV